MAHGGFLRQHSDDPQLASHIMHDYTKADLDLETRGMLDFATKLTREPTNMSEADVSGLRALGLSDEQILSVVLITCTFNFMTPVGRRTRGTSAGREAGSPRTMVDRTGASARLADDS